MSNPSTTFSLQICLNIDKKNNRLHIGCLNFPETNYECFSIFQSLLYLFLYLFFCLSCPTICLSIISTLYLSGRLSVINLSVHQSLCLLLRFFPSLCHLSIFLSTYLSIPICLSIYLPIFLSVYPSVCVAFYLFVYQSNYLTICLSIYLSN